MKKVVLDDEVLIEGLKTGKEGYYRRLFDLYEKKVYSLAIRITHNEEDAEEVLQDTFLAVFKRINGFRKESKLSSWIYRIAVNFALMKIRGRQRARKYLEPLQLDFDNLPDGNLQEREFEIKNAFKLLDRFINELPGDYRNVFILRELHDLSTEETASAMNLTSSAVKARLFRARNFLRERMVEAGAYSPGQKEKIAA